MVEVVPDYFTQIFSSSSPSHMEEAIVGLSEKVSNEANVALIVTPTAEEIHGALSRMHPNKAPVIIDGMHPLFKKYGILLILIYIIDYIQRWWHELSDLFDLNCIVLDLLVSITLYTKLFQK